MGKNHKWTEEEDRVLLQYVAEGHATKDIANLIGLPEAKVKSRIGFLRKKGFQVNRRNFKWTSDREKELAKILSVNNGNLNEGFRIFAEKYNLNISSIRTRYYNKKLKKGRVKDKYPIFSVFGRYRGIANAKIYTKKESKGYNFWSIVKKIFS